MEILDHFALGFGVAMSMQNLAYCFLGVLIGTLIGVLPGVGPLATMAMLLPMTFGLPPVSARDHARRHLLRRAVWRLDHGDPGQPARRDRPRWSPASTATRWRARAGPAPALAIAALASFVAGTHRARC